jgi:hypothetical protein
MNVQNKARELIEAGQKEVVLGDQRLEQNRARVLARAAVIGVVAAGVSATSSIGAASSAGAAGKAAMGAAAATKAAATFSIAKLAVAVVVVGGSVTGTYALATHTKTEPRLEQAVKATPPARTPVRQAVPVPAAPQLETESNVALAESEPSRLAKSVPPLHGAAGKSQASANNLSEHAELLREARAALTAGNAARALALLDGHREVARSPLGPEWAAARILVLCRLGRVAEAKQQGARFLKSHASSPLAAQVAASCAAR